MDLKLSGKRALVTGASQGIGLAIARALAREGCDLILVARSGASLSSLASELQQAFHVDVRTIPADLSSVAAVQVLAEAIAELDILVNNAGAIPAGGLHDVTDDAWRRGWDLKVFGYINLTRSLYSKLREKSGVIVNIIGAGGERLLPDYIAGGTANAALMAFTKSLGKSASNSSVRVVGINPGAVATERLERMLKTMNDSGASGKQQANEIVSRMPFGRAASPSEIADAVAFLASPLSAYTNATVLTIDGGAS